MMVYSGQGRSRLTTASDVAKAPFRCTVCTERFVRSDTLRDHMSQIHPGEISEGLSTILDKYGGIEN